MNTQKKLRLVQVNTTAWDEEDFLLVTDLSDIQIEIVLDPIIQLEREKDIEYDNEQLVSALKKAHPKAIIIDYAVNQIHLLSI